MNDLDTNSQDEPDSFTVVKKILLPSDFATEQRFEEYIKLQQAYNQLLEEQKMFKKILESRMFLLRFSEHHSIDELLQATLDELERLTQSSIGFYHFIDKDQINITLQVWSTNTQLNICQAERKGQHYSIAEAGVWVECVRKGHAVIHNNYETLANKKGLPPGHAPIKREIVVPVFRNDKIVAILGVGNKETDYNEMDLETVSNFADLAWDIASRIKSENELRKSEACFRSTFDQSPIGSALIGLDHIIVKVNKAFCQFLGYSEAEIIGMSCLAISHPDDLEKNYKELNYLLQSSSNNVYFEKRYLTKSGNTVWANVNISLVKKQNGEPEYFLPLVQDIT